ncbi:competence protein CoiA [Virgibacillus byunsanensis]|uniref:Competence protein CoiA n=1 Tax=Virgibacillus byunsanensis TaxID=570945 RepID=A0ABW3LQK5_9BACI
MLQAKTEYGNLVNLATLAKSEVIKLKAEEQFVCPTCNEPVIVKAGSKIIPHFAHRSTLNCPSSEGGEGPYHEKGKLLLYQWLKNQHLEVGLEVYLPEIIQRPDLLMRIGEKTIAMEFQCARVPLEQINSRNAGYMKLGITPIWVIGAKRFKRLSKHSLKIDSFSLCFIHQFSPALPLTLYYFCPETAQFSSFQHIHHINTHQTVGKLRISPINKMSFKDIFQFHRFSSNELYHLWKKEKRSFRLHRSNHGYGKELAWNQWVYAKGTHKEYLPSIIHLPVASQYVMNTPVWDWQSRLCLELLHPLSFESSFSIKRCIQIVSNHMMNKGQFPLIKGDPNPIREYLQLLVQLNILEQHSNEYYSKINPIHFHKNVEESLKGDELVLNCLMENKI